MNNQSELEQFIRKHTFADFAPGGDGSDVVMVDPEVLADYITADSKRVALEARKDEVGRIVERVWGLDYGEETEKYLSVRIAELKAQQEEV